MPTRAKHHDFEPSEQFGLRYSATGKLVKISDPEARGKEAITYTNCLDIFDLAEALDISLTEEQAQEEAEYIYENRRQFYNNHGYMKKKAIGEAYDGPVFNDDSLYRRSNGEKYTVRPDGSLESKAGKIIKEPNFEGFVHTFPRKHERTATFKEGRPRKDAAPVLTLPKQDNPLVQGECKTRTPEEESRAKAKECMEEMSDDVTLIDTMGKYIDAEKLKAELERLYYNEAEKDESILAADAYKNALDAVEKFLDSLQREQARKEAAKTTEEEKAIVREHYAGELTDQELFEELRRRDTEPLQCFTNDELLKELRRRGKDTPSGQLLQAYLDKELADELRRRGYTVTATKTIEI